MVVLVAFGDQIETRDPRAGGEAAKWGAIIRVMSHGTTRGQPGGDDAPAGFGLCTLWRELKDEDESFSMCPSPKHQASFPLQSSSEPLGRQMGAFVARARRGAVGWPGRGRAEFPRGCVLFFFLF